MIPVKIKTLHGDSCIEKVAEVEDCCTYYGLLRSMGVNPETVVVMVRGVPVPHDDVVEAGDVTVVRAVSAG